MRDDPESMWLCESCETWNGCKLDECLSCGRSRPRLPVRSADVTEDVSWRVSRRERLSVKARKLLGRVGR